MKSMKHLKLKKQLIIICVAASAIIILVIVVAGFYYFQYQKAQQLLKNPNMAGQMEAQDLVKKVGQLMYLPTDEQPTIATVSDYTKLQNQPFFKNAKNGFKVLIYTKAKEAILYDPFSNKIVFVGPLNTTQTTQTQQQSQTQTQPVNIAIYNGTPTQGLTAVIAQELKKKLSYVTIVQKSNASVYYPKTLVVDVTGNHQSAAAQMAAFLGGVVNTTLPSGEKSPTNADIVVILGK